MTLKHNERSLLELPDELLLPIFANLDDDNLLEVSRVCKRFKAVAATSFERTYHDEPFKIYANVTNTLQSQRAILINFGAKFSAIDVMDAELTDDHRWLLDLLKQNSENVKKLGLLAPTAESIDVDLKEILESFPKLEHLKLGGLDFVENDWPTFHAENLKNFELHNVFNIIQADMSTFFDNNKQIERFVCHDNDFGLIESINDRLHMLKHLDVMEFPDDLEIIKLNSLESLRLAWSDDTNAALAAFQRGCKNIKELDIEFDEDSPLDNDTIETICLFEHLTSLKITADASALELQHVNALDRRLPNLTSYIIAMDVEVEDDGENFPLVIDDVLSAISSTKRLSELELTFAADCSSKIDDDFHGRFVSAIGKSRNFQLRLIFEGRRNNIVAYDISKGGVVRSKPLP